MIYIFRKVRAEQNYFLIEPKLNPLFSSSPPIEFEFTKHSNNIFFCFHTPTVATLKLFLSYILRSIKKVSKQTYKNVATNE